jgi:hypothetical protein
MSTEKTFLVAIATIVLSLSTLSNASESTCTNATLHGGYGLHATGSVIGVGDFAAVGRFNFDGNGNLTAKLFVRINGNNLMPPQIIGTYTVHPDCTVSDQWGGSTHVSVIVDRGNGYFILNNTPGEPDTVSGEAKKIFSGQDEN